MLSETDVKSLLSKTGRTKGSYEYNKSSLRVSINVRFLVTCCKRNYLLLFKQNFLLPAYFRITR